MFLVRDIMYCKPGKARPMVEKFLALAAISERMGFGSMRVMTDVSAERYWTVVSEMEVPNLEEFAKRSRESMANKDFQDAMKGYHDLIEHGRREDLSARTVTRVVDGARRRIEHLADLLRQGQRGEWLLQERRPFDQHAVPNHGFICIT